MPKKPLYIQLEPGAYPKDIIWQMMTAEERGCYHSLIIFLACSNGSLLDDPDSLAIICNISAKKMEKFLDKFENKFIKKDGKITHKRVSDELRSAKKRMQVASASGLKGAIKRWGSHSDPIKNPIKKPLAKESEAKESKEKEKKNDTSVSPFSPTSRISVASDELKFYDLVDELFGCAKQSDKTTIQNIAKHLSTSLDDKVFSKAWKAAQECKKKGAKPIALFIVRMKDEFNYRKVK